MLGKFFIFILLFLSTSIGIISYKIKKNPFDSSENFIPYPFKFVETSPLTTLPAKTDIAIIGDRHAFWLAQFLNPTTNPGSQLFLSDYGRQINIWDLSSEQNNLARSLQKLKSLKPGTKWPKIIIYFGSGNELSENLFSLKDYSSIIYNFKQYNDDQILSYMMAMPFLTSFIYRPIHRVLLGEKPIPSNLNQLSSSSKLLAKELSFLIYQHLIEELIAESEKHKSTLIFITSPLNLLLPPKEVCSQTNSNKILEYSMELKAQLDQGHFKENLENAKNLAQLTLINSQTHFLYGLTLKGSGKLSQARAELNLAVTYDCFLNRSNDVYNSILRKKGKINQITLFDFALESEMQYLKNEEDKDMFIDDDLLQRKYYQKLANEVKPIIEKELLLVK